MLGLLQMLVTCVKVCLASPHGSIPFCASHPLVMVILHQVLNHVLP